ncbi:hypothetical protein RMSM_04151 [Rhodopirellula maiorica SM1]|uniref:Uncharacterized protein n=1 Tax=Rhodopirellula maiorica SM1 TaxID=1265738 RepID=M5RI11_9BACT|nr:DUF58 domain-containing protein [Rhodopirellula maiorica]EMI18930.1 hypothetical protein RMSM_04151 [Rhodopirellula maiorica SM1]
MPDPLTQTHPAGTRPWWQRSLHILATVLVFPLRTAIAIRRSATPASISMLLVGIISLNILWGYPWVGMFAACAATLGISLLVNQIMQPRLQVDFSLPRCVEAGQMFHLRIHLKNQRHVPALQLTAGVQATRRKDLFRHFRRRSSKQASDASRSYQVLSDATAIGMISPRETVTTDVALCFTHRGVHPLPDVCVKSMFPFCLFEFTKRIPSHTTLPITPRLLGQADEAGSSGKLSDMSGWIRKIAAAEAYDYSGSREYETGMSVRRWDFASWARLGKPIVQEFQTPGVRMAYILVDTASDPPRSSHASPASPRSDRDSKSDDLANKREETIEQVLSLAATCLTELWQRNVGVQLMITGESEDLDDDTHTFHKSASDLETTLIRLAMAKRTSTQQADEDLAAFVESMPQSPSMLITSREDFPANIHNAACKFMRVQ